MRKTVIAIVLCLVIVLYPINALANNETSRLTKTIDKLDPVQRNSLFMLNYLSVITQEIIDSSNNRLKLEEIYSILENDIKKSKVNDNTQNQLGFLFDTIRDYRTLSHKRDRLLYIYQQNQAQALWEAIPNPIGLLSAVQSKGWKGAVISAIYMAVDSVKSYKSFVNQNDLDYLLADWELDDTEEQILYNLRGTNFDYLVDMTHRFNLPDNLTLNRNNASEFIRIEQNANPRSRIILLDEKKDDFQGLAKYWLVIAQSYYEQGISKNGTTEDYSKCLEAIETYLSIPIDILEKDKPLSKVLPMAISAADECMGDKEYIVTAEKYADLIYDNTETNDWELRYFAALTYAELFERTNNKRYLDKAYRIARLNVTHLVDIQKSMNRAYLEKPKTQDVPVPKDPKKPTDAEKQKINDITQYNAQLENERKVALPPIYEPFLLNCELLLGISRHMEYSDSMKQELDEVLHAGGSAVFMIPTVDNLYWFSNNQNEIQEEDIAINFKNGEEIQLPATLITDGYSIRVMISNPKTGETKEYKNWEVLSVERKNENKLDSFIAKLISSEIKGFNYKIGMSVMIEVIATQNCTPQVLTFNYDVVNAKHTVFDYMGFWNKDYTFQRKYA